MSGNVNVTLPDKALEYIDGKAKSQYLSRSAVARSFLLEELNRKMVVDARRKGYSIRKIAEMTDVPYEIVLNILAETQVDQEGEDDEEEQLKVLSKISKN